MPIVAALLALALAAPVAPAEAPAPPAAGADGIVRAEEQRDFNEPPDGAPDDRALWRELRDGTTLATAHMARIAQGAFRIRYDKYYPLLDTMAEKGTPEQAVAAKALRARLEADARAADASLPRGGPSVRLCRYTLLFLEQRMEEPKASPLGKELPATRRDARRCAGEMRALAAAVKPRADALEETLAEVDRFLGRAPQARATPPAGFLDPLPGPDAALPASATAPRSAPADAAPEAGR